MESAQTSLLDFDLGESSDDSDFRIEDHCNESDDDSVDSNDEGKGWWKTFFFFILHCRIEFDLTINPTCR